MSATAYKLLKGRGPDELRPSLRRLAVEHLWLVAARCRSLGLRRSHPVWDDAQQDGAMAVLRAAERFDASRGVAFEHFARVYIDNAIKVTLSQLGPVRTPVKIVSGRAARGERAHAPSLPYLEAGASDYSLFTMSRGDRALVREIADHTSADEESAMADRIDTMRAARWLNERLAELPEKHADAVRAMGREIGVVEYARRTGVVRDTARSRTNAGLEYLRAAARELEENP